MLFKPKYCCSCGEKIERLDWGLRTSRKFCEICETDHLLEDWASVAVAMLALFIGIFGTVLLQRSARAEIPKDPVIQRAPESDSRKQDGPIKSVDEVAAPSPSQKQAAFFCGALTKKGTPCTRRVGVKGERCWQHRRE